MYDTCGGITLSVSSGSVNSFWHVNKLLSLALWQSTISQGEVFVINSLRSWRILFCGIWAEPCISLENFKSFI